jgi:hypothetical protein
MIKSLGYYRLEKYPLNFISPLFPLISEVLLSKKFILKKLDNFAFLNALTRGNGGNLK